MLCLLTWLRRGRSPLVAVLGVGSLVVFAMALTRVDSAFAGRAYAAYRGIYIVASLVWLWLAEGSGRLRRTSLEPDSPSPERAA